MMSEFDELPDELKKMSILREGILGATKALATMYIGFQEAGLPENIALELTKFYMEKAMNQSRITGSNYDE